MLIQESIVSKARDNLRAAVHAIQKAEHASDKRSAIAERHIIKGQTTNYDKLCQFIKRKEHHSAR